MYIRLEALKQAVIANPRSSITAVVNTAAKYEEYIINGKKEEYIINGKKEEDDAR